MARIVPHPRLSEQEDSIDAGHRVRILLRVAGLDRQETRGLRHLAGAPLRVPSVGGQNRKPERRESTRGEAERGHSGALDAPLPVRHNGERFGDTEIVDFIETQTDHDRRTGSEPRGRLFSQVRGGFALLQRVVRRARGRIGWGQCREAHGGAAVVWMRD
ncbi:hypothetical protein F2P56_021997 [Juglans regia]|uniref:Uncharacterized protein n=1 Tax=Juglans regia TaxID=51240 RepID=A0A833TYU4_JUGRE|nr:hypothetical protein F2P56_021997 [Juglans regia]